MLRLLRQWVGGGTRSRDCFPCLQPRPLSRLTATKEGTCCAAGLSSRLIAYCCCAGGMAQHGGNPKRRAGPRPHPGL